MERAYIKKGACGSYLSIYRTDLCPNIEKERKARKNKLKAEREKRILDSTPKWREIIEHWGKT
jgi:hypothetical protein